MYIWLRKRSNILSSIIDELLVEKFMHKVRKSDVQDRLDYLFEIRPMKQLAYYTNGA
jgi:hypothetical protein